MRAPATLVIDFHFDLICPWCLIGKRHLDAALAALHAELPQLAIELRWHGHELLPDLPPGGVPYQAFYERRLGGAAAVTARRAQVQAAAQQAGLVLAFERIRTMPNTRLAHCLLDCVRRHGTPAQLAALIDALFVAYFLNGGDIGDPVQLRCHAAASGLAPERLASFFAAPGAGGVPAAAPAAVAGVPFIVFNEGLALSGAQPPAVLLAAMREALATVPVAV